MEAIVGEAVEKTKGIKNLNFLIIFLVIFFIIGLLVIVFRKDLKNIFCDCTSCEESLIQEDEEDVDSEKELDEEEDDNGDDNVNPPLKEPNESNLVTFDNRDPNQQGLGLKVQYPEGWTVYCHDWETLSKEDDSINFVDKSGSECEEWEYDYGGFLSLRKGSYEINFGSRSDVPMMCIFTDTTDQEKSDYIKSMPFTDPQSLNEYAVLKEFSTLTINKGTDSVKFYKDDNSALGTTFYYSCIKRANRSFYLDFTLSFRDTTIATPISQEDLEEIYSIIETIETENVY